MPVTVAPLADPEDRRVLRARCAAPAADGHGPLYTAADQSTARTCVARPGAADVVAVLGGVAVVRCRRSAAVAADGRAHGARLATCAAGRPRRPTTPWPIASVAATAGDDRQASYAWEPSLRAGRATLVSVAARRRARRSAASRHSPGACDGTAGGDAAGPVLRGRRRRDAAGPGVARVARRPIAARCSMASQLAHAFPDMTCALLQPPRRPALDLTSAGREACAYLRIIGASLAEQGVSTGDRAAAARRRTLGARRPAARASHPVPARRGGARCARVHRPAPAKSSSATRSACSPATPPSSSRCRSPSTRRFPEGRSRMRDSSLTSTRRPEGRRQRTVPCHCSTR